MSQSSNLTQTKPRDSTPLRRGSSRGKAAADAQLTSQSIAHHLSEFRKRGGRIEVLGNTPLRPYASKSARSKAPARTPAAAAKKTGT